MSDANDKMSYDLTLGLQKLQKSCHQLIGVAEKLGVSELEVARLKKNLADTEKEINDD